MKKLNPVAKNWVAALRSGKTKQTTGTLGREDGSRCCLGVLCDLAVKAKVIDTFDLKSLELPEAVKDWARLLSESGDYIDSQAIHTYLIKDNDFFKKSFAEIADIIESQPEGLFYETKRKIE